MSRTIRRKVVFDVNAVRGMYVEERTESKYGGVYRRKIWKHGEEQRLALVQYHADTYPAGRYENRKSSRKIQHHVMIHTDPHLNYWC
jgi:hypothetical protein